MTTPTTQRLSETAIATELAKLEGWLREGSGKKSTINKTFHFANYHDTMAFVNATAWISHREDHHPDIALGYNQCTVSYTTHSAGGLSINDFACAAKIDALFAL
jgi:4a-hydroxytetrahydrobiopterin dehydratase